MAFGSRRSSHPVWDDALGTLGDYGDRAHDLYNDGLSRAAGYFDQGRDRAEDVYGRGRRRAADVYGESRHRVSGAADALAGRRSTDTAPILIAAAAGVLAGIVLTAGLRWWMRQPRNQPPSPLEAAPDVVEDPVTGDDTVTTFGTETAGQ